MTYLIYGDTREDRVIYYTGDIVEYWNIHCHRWTLGKILSIDHEGADFCDGIARAYVQCLENATYAILEASQCFPPGWFE